MFAHAVYAMGFYMDKDAAKQTCSEEFSCLPPASLEHNQALAERATGIYPSDPARYWTTVLCHHLGSCECARRSCLLRAVAGVKTAHDIEKSIRIIVTSGLVNQERFSKGLRESLEPRLRAVRPLTPKLSGWVGPSLGLLCHVS